MYFILAQRFAHFHSKTELISLFLYRSYHFGPCCSSMKIQKKDTLMVKFCSEYWYTSFALFLAENSDILLVIRYSSAIFTKGDVFQVELLKGKWTTFSPMQGKSVKVK